MKYVRRLSRTAASRSRRPPLDNKTPYARYLLDPEEFEMQRVGGDLVGVRGKPR
jgi:hypothetical protein